MTTLREEIMKTIAGALSVDITTRLPNRLIIDETTSIEVTLPKYEKLNLKDNYRQ